jgi:two-component system cell cycle sensor histidine kinase/response regulator CckA
LWQALETGEGQAVEQSYPSPSGQKYLLTRVVPERDEQGSIASLLAITRDITDRKQDEQERQDLEHQLHHSQKLESLGVLAGGIAHDLSNILTSVLGNADLALAEHAPSAPAREYLLEIAASARRAADLCRQMLAYSGRGHFVMEPIDLNALIEDMLSLLRSAISKKAFLTLHRGPGVLG